MKNSYSFVSALLTLVRPLVESFTAAAGGGFRRAVSWLCLALAVLALPSSVSAQSTEPTPDGKMVVARVAGDALTLDDVDRIWRREDPGAWIQNMPHLYDARLGALQIAVAEYVLNAEAGAAGVAPEVHIATLTSRLLGPPSEEEIRDAIRVLIRVQPSIPESLRRDLALLQLEQQRRSVARAEVLGAAYDRADARGDVRIFMDAPRLAGELGPALDSPAWGASAGEERVTVQVFSDFTCPFCARLAPRLDQLVEELPGDVRVVFRFYPASNRPGGRPAAEAASCAHRQGLFDAFHDELFRDPSVIQSGAMAGVAERVGLDAEAFSLCLDLGEGFGQVQTDVELGTQLGVRSTPTSFVNGRPVIGAIQYDAFRRVVDQEIERVSQ